ncbi:unnamed protein product, partial [Discosporangium mesarthrocarpum]
MSEDMPATTEMSRFDLVKSHKRACQEDLRPSFSKGDKQRRISRGGATTPRGAGEVVGGKGDGSASQLGKGKGKVKAKAVSSGGAAVSVSGAGAESVPSIPGGGECTVRGLS